MNTIDEKALIALLASRVIPDPSREINREEVEMLLSIAGESISTDDREYFESVDPMELILKKPDNRDSSLNLIGLSTLGIAAGFNRGGEEQNDDALESVIKKRAEIRMEIQDKSKEEGGGKEDD